MWRLQLFIQIDSVQCVQYLLDYKKRERWIGYDQIIECLPIICICFNQAHSFHNIHAITNSTKDSMFTI